MSKSDNGFSGKGDWVLFKAFLNENGRRGEFYINLNMKTGDGEIVKKDGCYSDAIVAAIAEEMA